MIYPVHLDIISKIPSYTEGEKRRCKRKIQETMRKYEYDEDFIESIEDNFCRGFGIAKDIIDTALMEEYWKQREKERS